MTSKSFVRLFVLFFLLLILFCVSFVIIFDPFFHYHKPLSFMQYKLDSGDQRYLTDGIGKHWSYDAIITGTSMTENFKSSEFDKEFNVSSIKIPIYGSSWKEIDDNLIRILKVKNPEIKCILQGLDTNLVLDEQDWYKYNTHLYPFYLYDNNPLNDIQYLLNKEVIFKKIIRNIFYTIDGNKTTSFDEYSNWNKDAEFGPRPVWNYYKDKRPEKKLETRILSENDKTLISVNVNRILALVDDYPDIQFYFFFTPYSILYFDGLKQQGELKRTIDALKYATSLMVNDHRNLQIFSFFDKKEIICDLNNYKDTGHYSELINSEIIKLIGHREGLLTELNYSAYWNSVYNFYDLYDYDTLIDSLPSSF